jgi:hypothetical protein
VLHIIYTQSSCNAHIWSFLQFLVTYLLMEPSSSWGAANCASLKRFEPGSTRLCNIISVDSHTNSNSLYTYLVSINFAGALLIVYLSILPLLYSVSDLAQSSSVPVSSHVCRSYATWHSAAAVVYQDATISHVMRSIKLDHYLLCFIYVLLCRCVSPWSTDVTGTADIPQCRPDLWL